MEVSAIVNSPKQQQKQTNRNRVLVSAASGAGIGAVINGVQSYAQQKSILKAGDEYVKRLGEELVKITDPQQKQEAAEVIKMTQDFVHSGKVNLKTVGITALKGALMFGAVFAGVELISNAIKNAKAKKQASAKTQKV